MSSPLDYLELCRLCLVKDRVQVPIFEDDGDVHQIFLKIHACLPVKVSRDDKLPKKICDDCLYKVELFYQFWNTTANAEKQLLQWLGEVDGLEDKQQGYVTEVLDSSVMKQEGSSDSRLDDSVMQVSGHQNMDINMIENMSIITMPAGSEQQFTTVPMGTTGGTVQTVQVSGPSTQTAHDQTGVAHLQEVEVDQEDEDNMDDGCDNDDDGLPVKEETDEGDRSLEQSYVSLPCDEAGPSGLQQQKISEMSEITIQQTADGDHKTGIWENFIADDTFMALDNIDYNKIKQDIIDSFVTDADGDRSCELCGESFMYVNRLLAHLRQVHGIERPFKCPHCDKAYQQRFLLNAHVKKQHGPCLVVACAHCSFSTLDRSKLERHIRRLHENELPVSSTTARNSGNYCSQQQQQQDTMGYLDDLSAYITPTKRRRGRPRSGRSLRPERTYLCALCGKELKTYKGLEIHTRRHTGEKPFKCKVCDKAFSCETLLRTHGVTHTGERPYVCDLCGKAFTQRSTLVVHKRYHSGERPYVCDKCARGFVTRTLLNVHLKICGKPVMD